VTGSSPAVINATIHRLGQLVLLWTHTRSVCSESLPKFSFAPPFSVQSLKYGNRTLCTFSVYSPYYLGVFATFLNFIIFLFEGGRVGG